MQSNTLPRALSFVSYFFHTHLYNFLPKHILSSFLGPNPIGPLISQAYPRDISSRQNTTFRSAWTPIICPAHQRLRWARKKKHFARYWSERGVSQKQLHIKEISLVDPLCTITFRETGFLYFMKKIIYSKTPVPCQWPSACTSTLKIALPCYLVKFNGYQCSRMSTAHERIIPLKFSIGIIIESWKIRVFLN